MRRVYRHDGTGEKAIIVFLSKSWELLHTAPPYVLGHPDYEIVIFSHLLSHEFIHKAIDEAAGSAACNAFDAIHRRVREFVAEHKNHIEAYVMGF